ncbi:MAG: hypothetical protein FWF69_06020 [Firmicutes bacterium]|nr:hypothetical protein [Bacillota bacterium]
MEIDLYELIAELEGKLEGSKKVLFTNQYSVDRDELLGLVQMIRDELPDAIKEASRVLKQEARILQDAKKHADNVLAEAEAKARTIRMESEQRATLLTTTSKEEAKDMVEEAKRQAEAIVDNAEHKAEELVAQTHITIRAEQQANEIITNARGEANRTHMAALDHVEDLLKRAENMVINVANDLRDARLQLDQER